MSSSENDGVKDVADPFHKKYKVLCQVGEGSYSKVVKCRNRKTAEEFACKRLKHCYRNWSQVNEINEVIVLKKLVQHTNILQFTDILFDPAIGRVSMVFELMEMNLYELIKDRKRLLPEIRVRNIIFQLIRGLRHLHRHGIFHRDVKPENLLLSRLNGEDLLKIGDLGSVRGIISKMPFTEYISTRWYRSPECLLTSGYYGVKMDVWAVGCVFYEVLTLRPLFPGSSELDQINRIHAIMGGPPPRIMERFAKHAEEPREYNKHHKLARFEGVVKVLTEFGWSPSKSRNFDWNFTTITKEGTGLDRLIPAHVSAEARDLIKSLLQYDPEARPTAHRAMNHAYFNSLREAARKSSLDHDMDEPEMVFDLNSELPRLGDNKLKRSELGKEPNSGIKIDGSRAPLQRIAIKLPKEVQSFSHRQQERELRPKKVHSVEQHVPKVEPALSPFPQPLKDTARKNSILDTRSTPSKLPLPYEKTYAMDQKQHGQKQYYTDLREVAKKTRPVASDTGNESTTKFVRQESESSSRAQLMESRSSVQKRPEVEMSTSRVAMKVSDLQRSVVKSKVNSQPVHPDEHRATARKNNPDARVKKVMTTSMFPVLTESGSQRKHKGDASANQKSSNSYERYMKDQRLQDFVQSSAKKGQHQHLNASVSDYKYIPKHQMPPHEQKQPQQRQVSGRRATKRLESKPSLHSMTKSVLQTNERRQHREPFVEPRIPTPAALVDATGVIDKSKLSPEDLRRINENRRLVKLDPIGSSDVEIRQRYENLISERASKKQSIQQREVEDSDDDPHKEIAHRVKRSRRADDSRRRNRQRRGEEAPFHEDGIQKLVEDTWNKPFPVEQLTQYPPNRENPSSNTYRRHRDRDREDQYSNSTNYAMEKPQSQYNVPNKQISRNSVRPIAPPQPHQRERDSSNLQALYGGSGRVDQRRSNHQIPQKTSRAPLGNVQASVAHYGSEYQNDRSSHYDQNKSHRTYRDGRQANNAYSPEDRHYAQESHRPSITVTRRPSPRNERDYAPVIDTKRSHGQTGRPPLESKIPLRSYQPSISRIPQLSSKRLEPYETQYNTSHYDQYRTSNYRDEGRSHAQREAFIQKTQQKERRRKSQIHARAGQQYQIEPTHVTVEQRLGLKPPKKPSASRIHQGNGMRTGHHQQHYGERRRGHD